MNKSTTKDWDLLTRGKSYNNKLVPNYYDTVNTNLEFFAGNQWINSETQDLPKPVFNIIKRVITFFVASMTSTATKVEFEPMAYQDDDNEFKEEKDAAKIATSEIENLFDKFKMDNRIRDSLFDAAITGDACLHFYFDIDKRPYGGMFDDKGIKGEICMEVVDGVNVYFGNANNSNVEDQPYIIIAGRDMVENLREEAKAYKNDENQIISDSDYEYQAGEGGKIEVDIDEDGNGKASYIIVYRKDKKTGTIKVSKSTEKCYIYKDVDTKLNFYPIAWMNWEKQKNQYHGRAICTGILPNQIFINRMFAMVMYHLMMTAFPKVAYNADMIDGLSNEIGAQIAISGLQPGESVNNMVGYIKAGEMSNQIIAAIELAMNYTKDTLGISDASLGNIDPKNTSAIIAVQKSSIIPLENPRANMYEWIEDVARVLLDMMGTYYGIRPIVVNENSKKTIQEFDFNIFKKLWLNIKVNVGSTSYWSEIAANQTLDNLLNNEKIDFIQYLERIDDDIIPNKQGLINDIKQRMQEQQVMNEQMIAMQQQSEQLGQQQTQIQWEKMAQFVESLPQETQDQLKKLPDSQYEQAVMQLMNQ